MEFNPSTIGHKKIVDFGLCNCLIKKIIIYNLDHKQDIHVRPSHIAH
jgi:hypothetical protein